MSDFEILDDFVKRAAELRTISVEASSFAAPLLLDLAGYYDQMIAEIQKRLTAH